jgi:beta-glucosidase
VVRGAEAEAEIPGGIAAAVAAAVAADVIVLVAGEHAFMSAEAQSRVEIDVPAPQRALAEALAATGKPMVVLLKCGRALELSGAIAAAEAILVTWFLGSEEGNAVADLLFGDAAPSGRLPVSFPVRSGQAPYSYAHLSTGRPETPESSAYKARFRETANRALYAFGHGLGYAPIHYGAPVLSAEVLDWEGEITARVTVTNSGGRAVEELAQLYLRDLAARVARPVRLLLDFQRLTVPPGGAVEARFTLRRADLVYLGPDGRPSVEPGAFDLWIAPDAQSGVAARFRLAQA